MDEVLSEPSATSPRGRDQVIEALLTATERLCAERPPSTVTLREVADEAGVNHGLIHHYIGSKPALLAATMQRVEHEVLRQIADEPDAGSAAAAFVENVRERPTYPRLLTALLAEGVDPTEHVDTFPGVAHLVASVADSTTKGEARLRVYGLLCYAAGEATTGDFMMTATRMTANDRRARAAHSRRVARLLVNGDTSLGP